MVCSVVVQMKRIHNYGSPPFEPTLLPLALSLRSLARSFALRLLSLSCSIAFSSASCRIFAALAARCIGERGMSSSRTPTPPGAAPRSLIRPSLRCSVMTGDAAGRYLNSSEYLVVSEVGRSGDCREWV